jgi:hypothetical protein
MYAINHAATALLLKKQDPTAPLLPLLISTQVVELLWVLFTYLGIEHSVVLNGKLHLDFLPYSHSVFSGVALAIAGYLLTWLLSHNKKWSLLIAIGILSHVVIDMLFHEPDIQLSPFSRLPVFGLGILSYPLLNFILELSYGLFCWWYYKGTQGLLWVIVIFNLLNLPLMFARGQSVSDMARYPTILPSVILFQILITWYFVYRFGKQPRMVSLSYP